MDAKQCDRCLTFFTYKDLAKAQNYILHDHNDNVLDLCPKCREGLSKWYKEVKEEVEE